MDMVGGIPTPLKNIIPNMDDWMIIPNIWENKTYSKPPTRLLLNMAIEIVDFRIQNGDFPIQNGVFA